MGNFTFADEHSTVYHVRLLKSPVSVLCGTRDKVITIPGRHGTIRATPDLGERLLNLDCWLKAQSITQLYERLDRVRSWLNPLCGVQRLTFDNTPDRFYLASYAGGGLNAELFATHCRFSIDFVCPNPFSYALSPDEIMITSSPYQHSQRGTAPSEPLLKFQAISTGTGAQQLKIAIGQQEFTYLGALASGDWLEIDCRNKTVMRIIGQTRVSVLQFVKKPVFPQLAPGMNSISIVGSGGATWSRLDINCRNRWL